MFDEKPEITEAVDHVYSFMATLRRGDILTHEQVAGLIGGRPHEGSWDHIVGRARKRLEAENGIATWYVYGVGYRLLTRAEQLELPQWRLRKGIRQIRKARKSLTALPEAGLTVNQRRVRAAMLERLAETELANRRELAGQTRLTRPNFVLPRRPLSV